MSTIHSRERTVVVDRSFERSNMTAVSVVLGIVLIASSYTFERLQNLLIPMSCQITGLGLLLFPALPSMLSSPVNWTTFSKYIGYIGCLEFLNLVNLEQPFQQGMLFQRILCYGTGAAGLLYGNDRTTRYVRFPLTAHLAIAGISSITAAMWLKAASSAAGVRFVGESDILTPVGVGYSFGVLGCVSAAFLLIEQRSIVRILHMISYCCCIMAIFSTGSRGSAAFCLTIAVGGAFLRMQSLTDGIRYSVSLAAVMIVLLLAVMTNDYASAQLEFVLSRFSFLSHGNVDLSIVYREDLRSIYYQSMHSWILFGLSGYDFRYPHNVFFECILRFGVVGFGLIFAIIYAVARAVAGLRSAANQPLIWVVSLVGLFTLLVLQVNLMLEHARFLWLFVGFWCVTKMQKPLLLEIPSDLVTSNEVSEG